jgi:threonine/homoserine/homoserine lactone efflux protein
MTFFTVMINILIFALCAGAAIAVLIYVPPAIYCIPYFLWLGFQMNKGKHKELKNETFFKSVRNATRLYISWISGRAPTFV